VHKAKKMLLWTHNRLKVKLVRNHDVVGFLFFFLLILRWIFEHYSTHWPVAHIADSILRIEDEQGL